MTPFNNDMFLSPSLIAPQKVQPKVCSECNFSVD